MLVGDYFVCTTKTTVFAAVGTLGARLLQMDIYVTSWYWMGAVVGALNIDILTFVVFYVNMHCETLQLACPATTAFFHGATYLQC
jgi:hypothetical protein